MQDPDRRLRLARQQHQAGQIGDGQLARTVEGLLANAPEGTCTSTYEAARRTLATLQGHRDRR